MRSSRKVSNSSLVRALIYGGGAHSISKLRTDLPGPCGLSLPTSMFKRWMSGLSLPTSMFERWMTAITFTLPTARQEPRPSTRHKKFRNRGSDTLVESRDRDREKVARSDAKSFFSPDAPRRVRGCRCRVTRCWSCVSILIRRTDSPEV